MSRDINTRAGPSANLPRQLADPGAWHAQLRSAAALTDHVAFVIYQTFWLLCAKPGHYISALRHPMMDRDGGPRVAPLCGAPDSRRVRLPDAVTGGRRGRLRRHAYKSEKVCCSSERFRWVTWCLEPLLGPVLASVLSYQQMFNVSL